MSIHSYMCNDLFIAIEGWKQENKELKEKIAALEKKLKDRTPPSYCSKCRCFTKYCDC